jgi:hypothetical protein
MGELHPRVFVLDFLDMGRGPNKLSTRDTVQKFGDMISLVISVASKHDEVVVRITSPGGAVMDYGLAASQVLKHGGPLTFYRCTKNCTHPNPVTNTTTDHPRPPWSITPLNVIPPL